MKSSVVRWTAYILVAALFAIACAFLSNWQFNRNEERAGELALVERNFDASPLTLDEIVTDNDTIPGSFEWHPVRLVGSYDADSQLLARNRPHGGTSAFEVLVPFRTVEGRVLLVDRGWLTSGEDASPAAVPSPPAGTVEVIVRLRPGEALPRSGRTAPEGQVPTINLPSIADELGIEMVTDMYGAMVTEDPAATESLGGFSAPTDDPGPHFSYAIQWILFAIMGFVFIGYIIRTEIRARREEAAGRTPEPPRRSKDRDAEDEDQLLDAATR